MGTQRRLIGPLFEEKQPQWVLAVHMHRMGDAARFFPRALDMLQAEAKHLIERFFARHNAARDQNHVDAPLDGDVSKVAILNKIVLGGSKLNPASTMIISDTLSSKP
jgi:hypothetical protein